MTEKLLREWKKVFEADLGYIVYELKELVERPCMIILEGELGVGKTALTKVFVGGDFKTSSPTYSVIQSYGSIVHADLYRLESREDLIHLEIPLYLEDKQFFLVEWGKKFSYSLMNELPDNFTSYLLRIEMADNDNVLTSPRNFTLYRLTEE